MDQQDYFAIREEERQQRQDRLRFAAGMSDFVGVILGVLVILVMLLLIFSLVNWLSRDITNTFTVLNTRLR
ncbi:MAG: hypothetical protein GX171_07890 [Clostridiales bacterium]|jgi:hypothetical protein|nr:hypothetical protein [Clostridiales bacterium]